MPEYLAPGVYVEETSFRPKSIEGVSTSTAGFVGPTRFGPTSGEPALLTSFLDFERIYGGLDQLSYDGAPHHNDLAHAVRGFFENGGRRLHVARTFDHSIDPSTDDEATLAERFPDFGRCVLNEGVSDPDIVLRARWPGAAGNVTVTVCDPFTGGRQPSALHWRVPAASRFTQNLPQGIRAFIYPCKCALIEIYGEWQSNGSL